MYAKIGVELRTNGEIFVKSCGHIFAYGSYSSKDVGRIFQDSVNIGSGLAERRMG